MRKKFSRLNKTGLKGKVVSKPAEAVEGSTVAMKKGVHNV